jgi:small subunit ribosomal protein S1
MNKFMPEGSLIASEENYSYIRNCEGLEKAIRDEVNLEAVAILCDHKLNLHVELGDGVKGIIPKEEILYPCFGKEPRDIAILTRVGKAVVFKVKELIRSQRGDVTAILSRKDAQEECVKEYISRLTPGDIIPSRVTHIESFGAFVDIGCGIISLLSIDSISVSRISHPKDRLHVGEKIYTVVKEIDETGKIFVSERELLGTWEENAAQFEVGETVSGIVRSVEDYGVFVELAPNLAGLAELRHDIRTGESVSVYIKSLIPEKMKIKLIIVDVCEKYQNTSKLKYYMNDEHIDEWRYTPEGSAKVIETVFR